MSEASKRNYPIDAVITWVDGNDENWQKKINKYSETKINWEVKKDTIRYNSINEIEIAIQSIIQYASFIRNIFLVTDDQTPEGFQKLQALADVNDVNLYIIDHTVIFKNYNNYLPCFNSCSIISMLHRIPNLAEHFIIFNDDTFLMRETNEKDFFKNGFPIIRGRWEKYYEDQIFRNIYIRFLNLMGVKKNISRPGYKKAQQKSAKLIGFKKYIKRDHTPVSLRKSTIENFFIENQSVFENNIKHRFRNDSQFIISSLSNHLEVKQGTYYLENDLQLSYFQSYKNLLKIRLKLYWFTINKKKLFMCFQNLEIAKKNVLDYILNWIFLRLN